MIDAVTPSFPLPAALAFLKIIHNFASASTVASTASRYSSNFGAHSGSLSHHHAENRQPFSQAFTDR